MKNETTVLALATVMLLASATFAPTISFGATSTAGVGEMDVCGRLPHDPNFGKPCPKKK